MGAKLITGRVTQLTGGRYKAIIASSAKPLKAVPTCTQAELEQAIKDMEIVAGVSHVQFLRGGPEYLVIKILLPGFQLKLEGFEYPVSPRGVRVVPKDTTA